MPDCLSVSECSGLEDISVIVKKDRATVSKVVFPFDGAFLDAVFVPDRPCAVLGAAFVVSFFFMAARSVPRAEEAVAQAIGENALVHELAVLVPIRKEAFVDALPISPFRPFSPVS